MVPAQQVGSLLFPVDIADLGWTKHPLPCSVPTMCLFSLPTVEPRAAEKQPGTRSCLMCAKTRRRPEARAATGWPHSSPSSPARGLAATAGADPAQQPWTRQAGGSEQDQSSAEEQGEPRASCPWLLRVCLALPLCFTPGFNGGLFVSRVIFPQRLFSLSFCILYFKHQEKKMALETGFVLEGNFYLMHLNTSGVLLLVWS